MHPELFKIPGLNITVPTYGFMVLLAFLSATWWATRRAMKVKADPDIILNIAFISLVTSTIGARAFYVIHYWEQFADNPSNIYKLSQGGFEVYGGVIGALVCCMLYGLARRLPLRLYCDIVMPSIMLGMGIGRIGCLSVGCCWGGPCTTHLPWAIEFPFGTPPHQREWEERQITIPADLILVDGSGATGPLPRQLLAIPAADLKNKLTKSEEAVTKAQAAGDAKKLASATRMRDMLKRGVEPVLAHYDMFEASPAKLLARTREARFHTISLHPSQVYGAIGCTLLALLTNAYFYRRKRHGTVMVLGFSLYAVQRFIEEVIRSDNPHDTFGLTISQGVSVGAITLSLLAYLAIRQMPAGSPNAKPWYPPGKTPPAPPAQPTPASAN